MVLAKQLLGLLAIGIGALVNAAVPSPVNYAAVMPRVSATQPQGTVNTSLPRPSAPKPVPAIQQIINGTRPGSVAAPETTDDSFCGYTTQGTCSVGLELSYDSSIMLIFIWDHNCKETHHAHLACSTLTTDPATGVLLGAGSGLQWDLTDGVSSQLPYVIVVTPHYDGAPSEFWYAGSHYQDGWNHRQITDNEWYDLMIFYC